MSENLPLRICVWNFNFDLIKRFLWLSGKNQNKPKRRKRADAGEDQTPQKLQGDFGIPARWAPVPPTLVSSSWLAGRWRGRDGASWVNHIPPSANGGTRHRRSKSTTTLLGRSRGLAGGGSREWRDCFARDNYFPCVFSHGDAELTWQFVGSSLSDFWRLKESGLKC